MCLPDSLQQRHCLGNIKWGENSKLIFLFQLLLAQGVHWPDVPPPPGQLVPPPLLGAQLVSPAGAWCGARARRRHAHPPLSTYIIQIIRYCVEIRAVNGSSWSFTMMSKVRIRPLIGPSPCCKCLTFTIKNLLRHYYEKLASKHGE